MDRQEIKARHAYWQSVYAKFQRAYIALIDGGVKSYSIDDRRLRRFDLPDIKKQMDEAEEKMTGYANMLNGKKPRRAFGVTPQDW